MLSRDRTERFRLNRAALSPDQLRAHRSCASESNRAFRSTRPVPRREEHSDWETEIRTLMTDFKDRRLAVGRFPNWGARIRTLVAGFRDRRPTVGRHPRADRGNRTRLAGLEDRTFTLNKTRVCSRWESNPARRLKRKMLDLRATGAEWHRSCVCFASWTTSV